MHTNQTRAAEIAEAEATLKRLEDAQYASSMSNGRYYSDGSKDRDDCEIYAIRSRLAELMRAEQFRS